MDRQPDEQPGRRRLDDEIAKGRRDTNGLAYKGSQLQIALYVNQHEAELDTALRGALPELADATIEWVSPLREGRYVEFQDSAMLEALGLGDHGKALRAFWPRGGPVWDALGRVEPAGVILVEGKSHIAELRGSGLQATSEASIAQIHAALHDTRTWLGVSEQIPLDLWCGPLYQSANRLAHLYFFREVLGIPAWFVHLLFVDDPTWNPTGEEGWRTEITRAETELGLPDHTDGFAHIFLPGLESPPR